MTTHPSSPTDLIRLAESLCAQHAAIINADANDESSASLVAQRILNDAASKSSAMPVGVLPRLSLATAIGASGGGSGPTSTTPRSGLKQASPVTRLKDCPYCNDSRRRFCPESGRRHETDDERALRYWRMIVRQLQFSTTVASAARLNQENTCAEEFFVEL